MSNVQNVLLSDDHRFTMLNILIDVSRDRVKAYQTLVAKLIAENVRCPLHFHATTVRDARRFAVDALLAGYQLLPYGGWGALFDYEWNCVNVVEADWKAHCDKVDAEEVTAAAAGL